MLDELMKLLQLDYLSDLKYHVERDVLIQAIESMEEDSFPSEEWKEAARYLCSGLNLEESVSVKDQLSVRLKEFGVD